MRENRTWTSLPCDLCGGEEHELLFVKEGFHHVRCGTCGMVFVNPRLEGHLDAQRISGTGTQGDEKISDSQRRRLAKELNACEPFRRVNRMLEIGPGRGWFLREATQRGWETWAVEINVCALAHLSDWKPGHILTQPAEAFEASDNSFDVVRMWDVIEHLENPSQAVRRIYSVLRPGGLLRLSTTNFASLSRWINGPEWVYLNGSDHIHLFEPETISSLLMKTGFHQLRSWTRSFNMRRKLYHPEKELPAKFPLLRPLVKIVDKGIRFTRFGHHLIVTAVKPEDPTSADPTSGTRQ